MIWVGFEPGPKNVSRLTLKNIARLEPGSIIFYHYASKTHITLTVRKQFYKKNLTKRCSRAFLLLIKCFALNKYSKGRKINVIFQSICPVQPLYLNSMPNLD